MKVRPTFFLLLSLPLFAVGQAETLIDKRDQKSYPITEVNGTLWMLENLDFETKISRSLTEAERKDYPDIKGRWYHLSELQSICPDGWTLPTVQDWVDYFNYLMEFKGVTRYSIKSYDGNIAIRGYYKKISLFEPGNPLNISSTGIFQGGKYVNLGNQADFWIADIPTKSEGKSTVGFKPVKEVQPGKSHIHVYDPHTQIHSHDHHLDPTDEETLRQFAVRCVCRKQDK